MNVRLVIFGALAVLLAGCGNKRDRMPGIPPVKEVEYQKHWITLTPTTNTLAGALLDLSLFFGVKPGITHEKAIATLGNPKNQRTNGHNFYYEYYFASARLEIGREEYAADGGIGVAWSLISYPNNLLYDAVLTPEAVKSISLRSPNSVIQLCDSDRQLKFIIVLAGDRVESVAWLDGKH
jgi:hypothetical protein